MFVGHYAVAFGAKRLAPKMSLGALVACAQLIDLVWPVLLLAGIEHVRIAPGITRVTPLDFHHYPFTHSLLGVLLWSALAGLVVFALRRRIGEAAIAATLVASHWFLDAIVHRPDLPLTFTGANRVGLGLWNSPVSTFALEGTLFGLGVLVYSRTTRARDRVGKFAWWSLAGLLAMIYVANLLGPPPPSVTALAGTALALWITPVWAWWADRHRELRQPARAVASAR